MTRPPHRGLAATSGSPGRQRRTSSDEASSSEVVVQELVAIPHLRSAERLLGEIWSRHGSASPVSAELLRAFSHAGHYVAGAFRGEMLVGVAAGFVQPPRGDAPAWELHSHITGVLEEWRGRGVGFALKHHQRSWAAGRDMVAVNWTFDPLVVANAHFNLTRLGASAVRYLENFYGVMDDHLNGADESDRLLVRWDTEAKSAGAHHRATARHPGRAASPTHRPVLETTADGHPSPREAGSAQHVSVALPADIVALREADPVAAHAWRRAVRDALTSCFARGFRITGTSPAGQYLLSAEAPETDAE